MTRCNTTTTVLSLSFVFRLSWPIGDLKDSNCNSELEFLKCNRFGGKERNETKYVQTSRIPSMIVSYCYGFYLFN